MIDWFDYHGHMCIVFEMLGLSVFDFLVSGLLKQKWTINTLIFFFYSERTTMSHTRWTKCAIWPINYATL